MNLRRPAILTDVHPEARNARNIGALSISLEAEHVCVKTAGLLQFFRFGSDADAVMGEFNDCDWYKTDPIEYISIAPAGRLDVLGGTPGTRWSVDLGRRELR